MSSKKEWIEQFTEVLSSCQAMKTEYIKVMNVMVDEVQEAIKNLKKRAAAADVAEQSHSTGKMDKEEIAKIVLQCFVDGNDATRLGIIETLFAAREDIMSTPDHREYLVLNWTQTLKEAMFPETICGINFPEEKS